MTVVPTYPTVADASIPNNLLNIPNVGFNSFGDTWVNNTVSPLDNGLEGGYFAVVPPTGIPAWNLNNGALCTYLGNPAGSYQFTGIEIYPQIIGDARTTLVAQLYEAAAIPGSTPTAYEPTGPVLQEVHVPASVIAAKTAAQINPTLGIVSLSHSDVTGPAPSMVCPLYSSLMTTGITTPAALIAFNGSECFSFPYNGGVSYVNDEYDVSVAVLAGVSTPRQQSNYPLSLTGLNPFTGYDSPNSPGLSISLAYGNNFIYGIGGELLATPGTPAIYYASVDGSGNVGQWQYLTSLPSVGNIGTDGLASAGASVLTGTDGNLFLFVIGGASSTYAMWIQLSASGNIVSGAEWTTQDIKNTMFNDLKTSVQCFTCNGETFVAGYPTDLGYGAATAYPIYRVVNNISVSGAFNSISLQPISLQTANNTLAAQVAPFGIAQTPSGNLVGLCSLLNTTLPFQSINPTYIMNVHSPSWLSNPNPVIGGNAFPVDLPGSGIPWPVSFFQSQGSGLYSVVGNNCTFTNYAYQMESFRIPFNYPITNANNYCIVLSIEGQTGPGSSIEIPLSGPQDYPSTEILGSTYNGSVWTGGNGFAGFAYQLASSSPANNNANTPYQGYVDLSATVVPRWQVVYWNQWSNSPECVISVAGNESEILFPLYTDNRVTSS